MLAGRRPAGRFRAYGHPQAIRFDSEEGAFWRFAMESVDGIGTARMCLTVEDRMTPESVERFPGGVAKIWNQSRLAGTRSYDRVLARVIGEGSSERDEG